MTVLLRLPSRTNATHDFHLQNLCSFSNNHRRVKVCKGPQECGTIDLSYSLGASYTLLR